MPGKGVHVAEVMEDVDLKLTGGVEVFPMGVKVYQSANKMPVPITGSGFTATMQFTFEPNFK